MIDPDLAASAFANSEIVASAEQVSAAYDGLAEQLQTRVAGKNALFMPVMQGGLIPAAELLRRCQEPMQFDYLHATRYRGAQQGGDELAWWAYPKTSIAGRHVVVVDDILDVGHTLLAIQRWLADQKPASVTTVVLCDKDHDRRVSGAQADLIGLTVPDRYVFGAGMDLHGYYRQLPAIHAVAA